MDAAYNAGTLSAGEIRIRVPASITVPANSFKTFRIAVDPALPADTALQGWITLDGEGSNDLHFSYYALIDAPQ